MTGKPSIVSSSNNRKQPRDAAQGPANVDKASRRRSRTIGPVSGGQSILDRARPVPGGYHDFHASETSRYDPDIAHQQISAGKPTIYYRGSNNPSADENFKPQVSTRGKIAALTGSDKVLSSQRETPSESPDSTLYPSRQASVQMLDASANRSNASTPNFIRHQPSVDSSKSKGGFLRRVFRSKPTTPRPTTPTYQLPPIATGTETLLSTTTSGSQSHSDTASKASSISKASSTAYNGRMPPRPTIPVSKDVPHVVQKKSSFFRRRKKSISDGLLVDAPLVNDSSQEAQPPIPSASTLRQAMDPFLYETDAHVAETGMVTSPTGTIYHDSREQQSRDSVDDKPFRFAPGSTRWQTSNVEPKYAGLISGHMTAPQNAASDSDDTLKASTPSRQIPHARTFPQRTTSYGSVSAGEQVTSQTLATPRNADPASLNRSISPSTMRQASASTAAQLSGNILPDHHSDEDWVDTTPFKRPSATAVPQKATRIRLDSDVGDDDGYQHLGQEPSSLMSDNLLQDTTQPSPSPAMATQTVPRLRLGHGKDAKSVDMNLPSVTANVDDQELAKKLFEEHDDASVQLNAATLLGVQNKDGLRHVYMSMFDFGGINILLALRDLCKRLALKGESQQVDRILAAFSERWCDCNPHHGFKSTGELCSYAEGRTYADQIADVVHMICYSILLLNTDLHIADVDNKMTKQQFVKNTLSTVVNGVQDDAGRASFAGSQGTGNRSPVPWRDDAPSPTLGTRFSIDDRLRAMPSPRPLSSVSGAPYFASPTPQDGRPVESADLLVGSSVENAKTWETQLGAVLREFFVSIRAHRLPLHSASDIHLQDQPSTNSLSVNSGLLKRAGSIVSSRGSDFKSGPTSWNARNRSKQKLYHSSTFGSSTTSFDDQPVFSPSASSTWSRPFGKATSAMSSDSLASAFTHADYGIVPSIGFASALANTTIQEEDPLGMEEDPELAPLMEDESLGLEGAPWAKEGMVHHKHHLETADKRAKNRDWVKCFAVIEKGRMRLFSFPNNKSQKNKSTKGGAVGGGNWMDNAEELASFTLRQTLANELPPPGYNKQRPHVFALMLATGGLHLFHVGTPEIATEFVSTANYWSARLSKEPLVGGVSNIEYGWSEDVLNAALLSPVPRTDSSNMRPPSSARVHSPRDSSSGTSARPSIQGSLRSGSMDISGRNSQRMPGDAINLSTWTPPQQSMTRSGLREGRQLEALKAYIGSVEEDLRLHNEFRSAVDIAVSRFCLLMKTQMLMMRQFSRRHPNHTKAMLNWERKSSYLLREIVKFRTYADALEAASTAKQRVYEERAERRRPVEI